MATTRIMPLHIGKGRTESRAISEIIDYVANPQKTDHGRLIAGYECDSRVADAEFMLAKRQYIAATGRVRGADDVIAYHVRQSFCPGEITPEEANRLGVEFAKRFTKGKHAFIVCTHIDKAHVHNHKSIFRSAMESRIIDHNPTIHLTTKGGGVPQEDRQALTDDQVERLLDAIRGLPPYVFVMIGLYAGLRREEILALQWDSVYLDTDTPYLTVRRAWHTEHNRPVILDELKTKAAERNIPLPVCLAECLKAAKATSTSEYVVSNRDGEPLSYTQFKRLWQYIVTRTVKERSYYRYEDGKRVKHTVTPVLGEKAAHNGKVVYSLDFEVTPHQLRHTYITNLIHASVDPKTVQYLAGHESSKITMDIYAKVKYNRPDELVRSMSGAFTSWEAV
ncbi:MAG: tyrosine-type recombinase/integrase [Enterocloster clostridioformis]|nr:tyrosine-type recombinase/integrase [Enterocloster clostridioformis]MCI6359671.1 tyrosine-type recombinase/integrase [Clostridiales bacterium]MDD6936937.1 tyrosine-type recombinase/integrase [Clostridiales bacterium]